MAPKGKKQKQTEGFTLIELMITVAIIGVLAAVAVPTLNKFINRAREAEAPSNLAKIADGARTYFYKEHLDANGVVLSPRFPQPYSGYNDKPAALPCAGGKTKYAKNPTNWANTPWTLLRFSLTSSHYFQYGYYAASLSSPPSRFFARARGDMDCDGKRSTFLLRGRMDSTTGELVREGLIVNNRGE